jgi:hypothetical protein
MLPSVHGDRPFPLPVTWLAELASLLQQPRVWAVQQRIEALMLEHAEELLHAALEAAGIGSCSKAEGKRGL